MGAPKAITDQKVKMDEIQNQLSAAKKVPLVATGDSHYATAEDHEAHEVMLSIQTHDRIDDKP